MHRRIAGALVASPSKATFAMGEKQKIMSDYDASAQIYDSRYSKIQVEKFAVMLEDLELKRPILDLGCGTGLLADFLKTKLIGCDLSFEMLKKAKARGELVVQADLDFLPFKENVFGAVLSFTAVQNLPKVEKALKEIKRVAKKDATIILTHLNKFDFMNKIKNEFEILEVRTAGEDVGLVLSADKQSVPVKIL